MKRTKITILALAAIAICSCKSEFVTYDTIDFGGTRISINESNISYQKHEDNVLETTKIPDGLDTAAQGRDYVYLENDNYYFVEDAVRNLLTIARKEDNTESVFIGKNFMFSYRNNAFSVAKDGGSVNLSYAKEGFEAPGLNMASFELVKGTDCESFMLAKVDEIGGDEDRIMITEQYGVPGISFIYISAYTHEESDLTDLEYLYALPCGEDVIYIAVNRTICNDDDIDMPIEADFEDLFLSFVVLI